MALAPSGILSSVVHCPRFRSAGRDHIIVYRVRDLSIPPFNVTVHDMALNNPLIKSKNTRGSLFPICLTLLWDFWWMISLQVWPTQRTICTSDEKTASHCAHTSLPREDLNLHMKILQHTHTHTRWISHSVQPHRWSLQIVMPLPVMHFPACRCCIHAFRSVR